MASYLKPTTRDTYTDSGKQRNYLKPMSNMLWVKVRRTDEDNLNVSEHEL